MSQLDDAINNCCLAEGGSHELDHEIMVALSKFGTRPFTQDFEAAVSLIPEGWRLDLEQQDDGWYAMLWPVTDDTHATITMAQDGVQKPPALAITIAALKAIREMKR